MKQFLKFLTKIKSFWKFYKNYGYDGGDVEFIIKNYQEVLCSRTKTMSKPTYYAGEVIKQIDEWYYQEYDPFRIWQTDNKLKNRIDISIEYCDFIKTHELPMLVLEKVRKAVARQ